MLIEKLRKEDIVEITRLSIKKELETNHDWSKVFKWWSKRSGFLIRSILVASVIEDELLFRELNSVASKKALDRFKDISNKKIVYDPFCGSGTIPVEALRLGFESVCYDVNPVAVEISRQRIELEKNPFRMKEKYCCLLKALERTVDEIASELWETPFGTTVHVLASRCPPCKVPLWVTTKRTNGENVYIVIDQSTGEFAKKLDKAGLEPKKPFFPIQDYIDRLPIIAENVYAYGIEVFSVKNGEVVRKFHSLLSESKEARLLREFTSRAAIKAKKIIEFNKDIFEKEIPQYRETKRLLKYNITYFSQLFSWRQLVTLYYFLKNTPPECLNASSLLLGNVARTSSLLAMYYQPYAKVNPGLVYKSYWLPSNPVELNPLSYYLKGNRIKTIGRGTIATYLRTLSQPLSNGYRLRDKQKCVVRIRNSIIASPPKNTYMVLTDPPYPGYHTYSELGLLYRYFFWLSTNFGLNYMNKTENEEIDTKSKQDYLASMRMFFKNIKNIGDNKYVIILLSITRPSESSILVELIKMAISVGLGFRRIYWVIGEHPGKLGRSKTKGMFILVFKIGKITSSNAIEPLKWTEYIIDELSKHYNWIDKEHELKIIDKLYSSLEKSVFK